MNHVKRACACVQRCDENKKPTLNQLALMIPIYPSPSAGNTCGVPRTVQHYGSSQSSCLGTKWVRNIFCWGSSSRSGLEEESWAEVNRGQEHQCILPSKSVHEEIPVFTSKILT